MAALPRFRYCCGWWWVTMTLFLKISRTTTFVVSLSSSSKFPSPPRRSTTSSSKDGLVSSGRHMSSGSSSNISSTINKTLFPYQQEGVHKLVSKKRLLLADEMGLGKTIQCIEAINRVCNDSTNNKLKKQTNSDSSSSSSSSSSSEPKILIVCPKSVLGVWQSELNIWLDPKFQSSWDIQVATTKSKPDVHPGSITLINYDICHKLKKIIQKPHYDILICDEAHYLKTPDTQRTEAILGGGGGTVKGIQSDFLWLLTGTPVLNRPIELFPLLHAINPTEFPDIGAYAMRYCDPKEKVIYTGRYPKTIVDYSGSSNLKELSERLDPIMLRRYKMDVLSQLPEKFRSCTCLTPADDIDIAKQERELLLAVLRDPDVVGKNATTLGLEDFGSNALDLGSYINEFGGNKQMLAKISAIRQETAFLKLKPAVELLEEYTSHEKVVVFVHHKAVHNELTSHFGDRAVGIIGGMKGQDRDNAVRMFQEDPNVRLFVGSIRAAGVGLTLTAASHVVFLELDWSPGVMTQAEDRCHRVGQQNNVRIQYLVFKDTIDEWISKSMLFKQSNINEILPEKVNTGGVATGYVFDFGKHEGVRLEDVPRPYVQFLLKNEVWRSRQDLWLALYKIGQVSEPPPPPTLTAIGRTYKKPEKKVALKDVDFVFDFGKHSGKHWKDVPEDYRDWLIKEQVWKSKGRENLLAAVTEAGMEVD